MAKPKCSPSLAWKDFIGLQNRTISRWIFNTTVFIKSTDCLISKFSLSAQIASVGIVISQCICNIVLVFCTVYYPVNRPLSSLGFCFKRNSFRSSRLQHTLSQLQLHKTLPVDKFYADLCVVPAEQKMPKELFCQRERVHSQLGNGHDGADDDDDDGSWKLGSPGPRHRTTEGYMKGGFFSLSSCYPARKQAIKTHYVRSFVRLFLPIGYPTSLAFVSGRYIYSSVFCFGFMVSRVACWFTHAQQDTIAGHTHTHTHKYTEDIQKWQWRARPDNGWKRRTRQMGTVNCELRTASCELWAGTGDLGHAFLRIARY